MYIARGGTEPGRELESRLGRLSVKSLKYSGTFLGHMNLKKVNGQSGRPSAKRGAKPPIKTPKEPINPCFFPMHWNPLTGFQ